MTVSACLPTYLLGKARLVQYGVITTDFAVALSLLSSSKVNPQLLAEY